MISRSLLDKGRLHEVRWHYTILMKASDIFPFQFLGQPPSAWLLWLAGPCCLTALAPSFCPSLPPSHLMSWGKRELGTLWVVPAGYATTRHKSMRVWHTPTCCVELGGEKRTETALHNGKNPLPSSPLTLAACWISCINCRISATTYWFSTKFLCAVCGFLKDNQRRKALDSFVCLFVLPFFFFPLVLAPFYKLFLRC